MVNVHRFTFPGDLGRDAIERLVGRAFMSAEIIEGCERVRVLCAGYRISGDGREVEIDTTDPVGGLIARLFAGYAMRALGDEAFRVDRGRPRVCPSEEDGPATARGEGMT